MNGAPSFPFSSTYVMSSKEVVRLERELSTVLCSQSTFGSGLRVRIVENCASEQIQTIEAASSVPYDTVVMQFRFSLPGPLESKELRSGF